MTAELTETQWMSVEEYLAWEPTASGKHEFIDGVIYAMAGAKNRHNLVASNALVSLGGQLRGKSCKAYNSDTKVRVVFPTHSRFSRFYYPDAMVVCQPSALDLTFQEGPALIIEVISEKTRRTDEQEKREAYLTLPTLQAYIVIEQTKAAVTVWRRTGHGFQGEIHTGGDSVIDLPEVGLRLALAEVYEAVSFGLEPDEDDESA